MVLGYCRACAACAGDHGANPWTRPTRSTTRTTSRRVSCGVMSLAHLPRRRPKRLTNRGFIGESRVMRRMGWRVGRSGADSSDRRKPPRCAQYTPHSRDMSNTAGLRRENRRGSALVKITELQPIHALSPSQPFKPLTLAPARWPPALKTRQSITCGCLRGPCSLPGPRLRRGCRRSSIGIDRVNSKTGPPKL